jgi:hypothetical protein
MTQAFNLSQFANNVDSSGKAILTSGQAVTGILPVANGGSGAATFSSGSVLLGSGTSSFGTVAPGTSGNLLTSNGTTWTSASAPITGQNLVLFNASGTWTVPTGVTKAIVYVYGSGGNGYTWYSSGFKYTGGGAGGYICAMLTGLTPTAGISITVQARNSGASTTSFGSYVLATGGTTGSGGGTSYSPGSNGSSSYASGGGITVTTIAQGSCGTGIYDTNPSTSFSGFTSANLYELAYTATGILGGSGYGRPGVYDNSSYVGGSGAVAIQY